MLKCIRLKNHGADTAKTDEPCQGGNAAALSR